MGQPRARINGVRRFPLGLECRQSNEANDYVYVDACIHTHRVACSHAPCDMHVCMHVLMLKYIGTRVNLVKGIGIKEGSTFSEADNRGSKRAGDRSAGSSASG